MVHLQVNAEMRIAWEEPFGPVIPVIRVSSVEQAIDHCNSNNLALQARAARHSSPPRCPLSYMRGGQQMHSRDGRDQNNIMCGVVYRPLANVPHRQRRFAVELC